MLKILENTQKEIIRTFRSFVDKEIRPDIMEWEKKDEFPKHLMKKIGDLGGFGGVFAEKYGGTNIGVENQLLILEELAKGSGGIVTTVLVQILSINPIYLFGNEEQKRKYLVPGITGEKVFAIGITEPNHGSNVAGVETKAVRDGDHYIINGAKTFITNGTFADYIVLVAKTDQNKGRKGISLFIFDTKTPGFKVTKKLEKLGWHTSETAEMVFEDCRVPAECLLGEENNGFYYIMEDFNMERLYLAAESIGLAEEALNLAIKYAKERLQFGEPITRYQAVQHKLADMATKLEAARQLTYQSARLFDSGSPAIKEASMSKYFASEMVNQVCYDAIQIFGGNGFMKEYSVERIYRDARVLSIGGGTSEIQKNIIAKKLLEG
jgi:acyl-CoA dehydrogenase